MFRFARTRGGAVARTLGAILLTATMLSQTACSFFGSSRQTMSFSSDPSGAKITVNGEVLGVTPLQAGVRRESAASIMASKDGYESQTRFADNSLSTLGVLDVIGGIIWLVPFLGLISDAAWENEPDTFSFVLEEKK